MSSILSYDFQCKKWPRANKTPQGPAFCTKITRQTLQNRTELCVSNSGGNWQHTIITMNFNTYRDFTDTDSEDDDIFDEMALLAIQMCYPWFRHIQQLLMRTSQSPRTWVVRTKPWDLDGVLARVNRMYFDGDCVYADGDVVLSDWTRNYLVVNLIAAIVLLFL